MWRNQLILAIIVTSLTIVIGNQTICNDEGCQFVSKFLSSKVDDRKNPCRDFYWFVCGKVVDDKKAKSTRQNWKIEVDNDVQKILRNSSLYGTEFPIRSAKRFYERCLDLDVKEVELKHQVVKFIEDFADRQWPMLISNSSAFDVWNITAKLQGLLSIPTFFDFKISPSKKCESEIWAPNVDVKKELFTIYASEELHIAQNLSEQLKDFAWDSDELLTDSICESKIVATLKTLFPKKLSGEAINQVCQFEHILLDYFKQPDVEAETVQELFLDELDTIKASKPVWNSYFTGIANYSNSTKLHNWFKDKRFSIDDVSFLEYLVKQVDSTPKDVVGNYLFLKIVTFASEFFTYQKDLNRTAFCLKATKEIFPRIVGRLYVNPTGEFKNNSYVIRVEEMIRSAAKDIFKDNQWLTAMAKVRMNRKVDNMKTSLEQDQTITNISLLSQMYADKKVKNNDNFFEIVKRFKRFSDAALNKNFGSHGTDMDEFDIVSAYISNKNFAFLPYGLLKNIGFYDKYPDFYTFGVGGSIIAKNMLRGFTRQGGHFNYKGSRIPMDGNNTYLLHKSTQQLTNLTQCFTTDYESRCSPLIRNGTDFNPCVNWKITNNIVAHFMGLKVAFKAYQRQKSSRPTPESVTHFTKYTKDQMFFISYASTWCSYQARNWKWRKDLAQMPDDLKVNQVLSNLPEFRTAFKCKRTDKMYQNSKQSQCTLY